MACSYKRDEAGSRRIFSFHHPGDFCDLHQFVLPERDGAIGVQALTDAVVAVIDHRDMDRLLARPKLAVAFWRATMLEAAIYPGATDQLKPRDSAGADSAPAM
jgi:CRP-like cAMP-binding protein